jgi:carboxypeptidase D
LVAGTHGDEAVGRELLLRLAYELATNYGRLSTAVGQQATTVLDAIDLYIVPSANPDGHQGHRRNNARNVDLNRDFPDQYIPAPARRLQPETLAIVGMSNNSSPFALCASLHGGALVANYPWDSTDDIRRNGRSGVYAAAPDDVVLRAIAQTYANSHRTMHDSKEFPGGITNGAHWYELHGGLQDWDYVHENCMSITLELSQTKWPSATALPSEWLQNREALYQLVQLPVSMGVAGVVRNAVTLRPIPRANIIVKQINKTTTADGRGCYVRMLVPGTYTITATAPNYAPRMFTKLVVTRGRRAVMDLFLHPMH